MKKKYFEYIQQSLIKFACLILCVFIASSCSDEIIKLVSTSVVDEDILIARAWYDSNMTDSISLNLGLRKANSKVNKTSINTNPIWENAYKTMDSTETIVIVPLSMKCTFGFVSPEAEQMYYKTKDERYLQNKTQMVIRTNKKKSRTDGFLMTLVPDANYMTSNNFDTYSSSYRKWQKGYNGMVIYHTLYGDLVNGWYIADGKVTKTITGTETDSTISYNANQGRSLASKKEDCIDYTYTIWVQDCIDWYVNGIFQRTTCDAPYPEDTSSFIVCPPENGGGGGGGGYGDPPVVYDCFGVENGAAYRDNCNDCVGGTTNKTACIQDCAGVWGGKAFWNSSCNTCIKPADPCAEINKIKVDATLIDTLNNYIDKAKNKPIEYGHMKKTDGNCIFPISQTAKNVHYEYSYTGKFTEKLHSHDNIPGGGTYVFSGWDLINLYNTFFNQKMDNPATFKYIVVSAFGIGSLNITDPAAFTEFGNNNNKESLDKLYRDTPIAGTEMKDYLKQFLDILKNTNSGLTFSLGEFDMVSSNPIIEWNTKQLDSSGSVTNKNCN